MKSTVLKVSLAAMLCGVFFAFSGKPDTAISGRVSPADAVEKVWAITGKDSVSAGTISGAFLLKVSPGTFTVIVDAKDPYKDKVIEKVEVTDGSTVDMGEIKLEK